MQAPRAAATVGLFTFLLTSSCASTSGSGSDGEPSAPTQAADAAELEAPGPAAGSAGTSNDRSQDTISTAGFATETSPDDGTATAPTEDDTTTSPTDTTDNDTPNDGLATEVVTEAGESAVHAEETQDSVVSDDLPDLDLIDVSTGRPVNLRSLAPAATPLLLWFWAPH